MSRMRVMFIKSYNLNGHDWKVGHKTQMRTEKAKELLDRKIIQPYIGKWPPKQKTKFNLKDLK